LVAIGLILPKSGVFLGPAVNYENFLGIISHANCIQDYIFELLKIALERAGFNVDTFNIE
jgi:hypothetical protein